jgi:hypothetical protein
MAMPWTLARDFLTVAARLERERLLHASIAYRAAQSDDKSWAAWLKTFDA